MTGYIYIINDNEIIIWPQRKFENIEVIPVKDLQRNDTYGFPILVTDKRGIQEAIDEIKDYAIAIDEELLIRVVEVNDIEMDDGRLYVRPMQAFEAFRRGKTILREKAKKTILLESQLLASSPTIEGIKKLIAEFWYDSVDNIELIPYSDNVWQIRKVKSQKIIDKARVIKTKNRYKFEIASLDE